MFRSHAAGITTIEVLVDLALVMALIVMVRMIPFGDMVDWVKALFGR